MASAGVDARSFVLEEIRGRSWFATRADAHGVDDQTGLAVTADVTGWVVDVEVPELTPELRTAEGLLSALRRAIGAAMLQHLLDNAKQATLTVDEREHAQALLAGRTTLTPTRVPRSPAVVALTEPQSPPRMTVDERWDRRWAGGSRDREVRVVMSVLGGLEGLQADAEFLRTARPDLLRYALREAFSEADRAAGEELQR